MTIQINTEIKAYIDPLTANEYEALERSILREGCRDALILWGDTLIDGHNRYAICQQHGLPFKTIQNTTIDSMEDVILWLIDNHIGRRSVTDFQRGMLALRKKEIVAARSKPAAEDAIPASGETPEPKAKNTREDIAKAAGISSNAVTQIEKIQKAASPELVNAVRAGTISISAAAAIASLPEEQQASAVAGGRKELQQAAKLVREMKAATRPAKAGKSDAVAQDDVPVKTVGAANSTEINSTEVALLHKKIAELSAENLLLKARITELTTALSAAQPINV
ncbi:hypothetical protein LPB67_15295 [Undibacterium sp. Jales W-56]|uniref:hypothetical protein n=1 Tax=Undibacterium sp. Jales W-56 TaxID=2897325 RepID=UPI0021D1EE73|nr:hypothetical protein [Undibacterium sp. Jales W-56]MCU6435142.1 hypothetical protein [Undibacterium sp. Jales W-56]